MAGYSFIFIRMFQVAASNERRTAPRPGNSPSGAAIITLPRFFSAVRPWHHRMRSLYQRNVMITRSQRTSEWPPDTDTPGSACR